MQHPQSCTVGSVLAAACQGHLSTPTLATRLAELDAFRGTGRDNAIARWNGHILDALPKLNAREPVSVQLAEKLTQANLLLQLLSDAGIFPKLHASVLRCLFEDGQRLQALMDVRELESKQQEQQAGPCPLHEVVVAAGQACAEAVAGSGDRAPEEVFYALPTSTVAQFFKQVAAVAANAGRNPGQASVDFDAVAQLSKGVQVALGGAMQQRAHQQQWYGLAINVAVAGLDEPEWTAGKDVRAGLQMLAEACCRLHPRLVLEAPQQISPCVLLLFELTDRLLNACAAAVTAAPIGRQRQQLHIEYAAARDQLLEQLLEQALALSQEDQVEGLQLIRRVQGMASSHGSNRLLYEVAFAVTHDFQNLYEEMQQQRGDGLDPPLTTYVWDRLLKEGRFAFLLDQPHNFDAELQRFLSDDAADNTALRLQIRWLHEVRMQDYSS
ncbi:expressed protein, partial [Chlorella variabilis]